MSQMGEAEAKQFAKKLKEFRKTLSKDEKKLFDAILRIAWQVAAGDDLGAEFEGSFSPDQADLILAYRDGQLDVLTGMIGGELIRASAPHLIRHTGNLIRHTPHD